MTNPPFCRLETVAVDLRLTLAFVAVLQCTSPCPAQDAAPDQAATQSVTAAKPTFAARVLPSLRDRDPESALQALDPVIDTSLTVADLLYSDLPSAAAALHRALAQLSSDQQYDLLEKWTLPSEQRNRVRVLSTPVPTDAPPKVFARSIGERPRDDTFAVASVGPVPGFFCNAWMFVQAANDLGRLPRLRITLEELSEQNVSGAEDLLVLSQLLGSRGDLTQVSTFLEAQTLEQTDVTPLTTRDMNVAAIAAAALQHDATQAAAETYLASLVARSDDDQSIGLRPFLRIAHAVAAQGFRGESSSSVLFQNNLKYWVPTTVRSAQDIQRGHPHGLWLTHERHVLHLAGGTADILFCRFPLVGQFDFVCETQSGGAVGTDGGLAYGGLQFQAIGRKNELTVWDADTRHSLTKTSPFARTDTQPVFNHVSIRSTDDACQFESNFHPVWFDREPVRTSPWIGLRSSGTKRPVYRNLKLTGQPEIPRQIALIAGDQLRGWQSGFYGESQPIFQETASSGADHQPQVNTVANAGVGIVDWQLRSGELVGNSPLDSDVAAKPGLLQYQRPLLEGESITYQFLSSDESSVVHPAVGRLAFLLETTGVRVRWITTGANDWTGLPIDNAALEPLNRRGPRKLSLNTDEPNNVRAELSEGKILLHLNEQLIYQRDLEPHASTQFGLYRSSRETPARIQSVVMTGNWPTAVPQELLDNPVATEELSDN